MPKHLEWLDDVAHPKLRFDGESIEITYQPVAVGHGPGPIDVHFMVECVIEHSLTGSLIYTADELWFAATAFKEFAQDFGEVLEGKAQEAVLAPTGSDFVVTVRREDQYLRMHVDVKEWQGPHDPETTASAACALWNTDRTYRWVRDLGDYSQRLDEWVLENPAS